MIIPSGKICTLYFLGEAFQNGKTLYPHKFQLENTDESIAKLFRKIKVSDYMPALCIDKAGDKCSRGTYGILNGELVKKTKENKDDLSEVFQAKFSETDIIVIDCDGKITIDEFKKLAEPYHYFLITTRSHGLKPGDHFRVGFPLGVDIKDETTYLDYLNRVITFCKGDKSCSDPVRMFFASGSKAVYDYHRGKSIMEWLTNKDREELLNMPNIQEDMSDPKTLDHWYGLTIEETKRHFKTCDEGERNAHLFGATGHLIFSGIEDKDELLKLIEECNNCLSTPKNWREERPKIIDAIDIWKKRKAKIEEEKNKPENKYTLDDISLAQFFADEIRNDFRWCEEHNIWYHFNKGIWEKDYGLRVQEACKRAMKKRIELGRIKLRTMPSELKKEYIKSLKKLKNSFKRNSIIKDTRDILAILVKEFDCHDTLLNFKNGTYNLDHGIFYDHDRTEYHTKSVSCDYDPYEQPSKLFLDFLDEIFQKDSELIEYIQKIFGISLTGISERQEFYILHGEGGNGKSVLVSIFSQLLDSYVYSMDAEKIMSSNQASNKDTYLAQFKNKLAIFCFEGGQGKRLNIPLIKLLTGGEMLNVAQKYEVACEFKIKAKPFLITNPKPKINDSEDTALWRRLRMIPFDFQVQEEKRILGLEKILLDSGKAGIMNWFIEGWKKYKKDGLKIPESVLAKTKEYKDESDELKIFIEECCTEEEGAFIQSSTLFDAYIGWSTRSKYDKHTQTSFSLALKKKGFLKKAYGEKSRMHFFGLKLSENQKDGFAE